MRKLLCSVALLAASGLVQAGLFDDDVARQQVADLTAKVNQLQQENVQRLQMLEAGNKRVLDLVRQLDQQKEEIAQLRGQLEVLQFNQDESAKRQKDLYIDLDNRLRTVETAKPAAGTGDAAPLSEQQLFDNGVAQVKAGKHKEALATFDKFLADYPESKQLSTAQYWQGVSYAATKNYKAANSAFGVVANTADAPNAPDALLGLASVAAATGDKKTSRKYLVEILERFPSSNAAATAKKALTAVN
ncbi:tol-pal system protein YbgF [Chitinilyticum piscinae]|uniref:Cell division coordinator CpoB n=1 Tax=Chitinilyticum piscinae TaxID=2866724 RepID=A0A8J7K156_9NEIS|nr:tol-pal system protein YbgF [Chitinilyticum piscinae]MBE9608182.1 tol-pal system protein YbgF [Chitinilyticum piscinae]